MNNLRGATVIDRLLDFEKEWTNESALTLKLFRVLTDASLANKVDPQGRTLGRIAWHIVLTLGEMAGHAGLPVEAPPEETPVPVSASSITATYERAAQSLQKNLHENWSDAMLADEIDMYGEKWTRGFALYVLVKHEIHHRAQMTVLMRQAGLRVPGLYGPSREEWSTFGAPAAE
jgi:uncharacterized damage-inducible protein DinB